MGIIAAVGDNVNNLKIGAPAAVMTFGSYAEFMMVYCLNIYVLKVLQTCCYYLVYFFNSTAI